jgi:hypothetical protein
MCVKRNFIKPLSAPTLAKNNQVSNDCRRINDARRGIGFCK